MRRATRLLPPALLGFVLLSGSASVPSPEAPTATWYAPGELEGTKEKPPAVGLETVVFRAETPLFAAGEELAAGGFALDPDGKLAAFVLRKRDGATVRLVELRTRKAVWEHPWSFDPVRPVPLVVGLDLLSFEAGFLSLHSFDPEGSSSWLELQTGKLASPVSLPAGHRAIAMLGSLPDGRPVAWCARRLPPQNQGDRVVSPEELDGRIVIGGSAVHPPEEIRTRDLLAKDEKGFLQPAALLPGGLLLAAVAADDGKTRFLAYELLTRNPRWRRTLEDPILELKPAGDRIVVHLGKRGTSGFLGIPDAGHIVVLDSQTGRTCYSLPREGEGGRYPSEPEFLAAAADVDLYRGKDPGERETVFAVHRADGRVAWRSDGDPGGPSSVDVRGGEVTLVGRGDWGIRFEAATGKQTALVRVEQKDGEEASGRLRRAGDLWFLGASICSVRKEVPIREAHIREAMPYLDTEKGTVTVIPEADEALSLLIGALRDKRVEYRRGAVKDLLDFAMPSERGPAVPALIRALEDEDAEVRTGGILALGDIGEEARTAIPALERFVRTGDPAIRMTAALSLGLIDPGSDVAAPIVAASVRDGQGGVRLDAWIVAAQSRKKDLLALALAILEDEMSAQDVERRQSAAAWIAGSHWGWQQPRLDGLGPAAPALGRGLVDDPDDEVRFQCGASLETLGPRAAAALPAVRRALKDARLSTRRAAYRVLAEIGPERVDREALDAALKGNDEELRGSAAKGLGRLGPEGVSVLQSAMEDPDPALRRAAVGGLLWAGPAAAPAVGKLIDKVRASGPAAASAMPGSEERRMAMRALGAAGPAAAAAVPILIEHARGGPAMDADTAIRTLGEIGAPAAPAVPLLLPMLDSKEEYDRWLAATVLGGIGPPAKAAIPRLRALAGERAKRVREAAKHALERIEGTGN